MYEVGNYYGIVRYVLRCTIHNSLRVLRTLCGREPVVMCRYLWTCSTVKRGLVELFVVNLNTRFKRRTAVHTYKRRR